MRLPVSLRSLRLRLLAGTLVWIIASLVVAGWGLQSLFRDHVALQFRAELRTYLDQLTAALALDASGRPSLSVPLTDPRLRKPYSGLYWQIEGVGRGAPAGLLRSRSLWDSTIAVPPDTPADGEDHWHRVAGPEGAALGVLERVVTLQERSDQPLRLIVAADERLMMEPVERFTGALWLALAVLGAGLVIAAITQVAIGLAPLHRLRRALSFVRDGKAQRLEGDFPSEIKPLVEEFNAVLSQNTEIVVRARTQAGNLAHALKTPLAVLANAARAGKDEERSELARLVVEQVDAATRQVAYHLSRARAAAAVAVPGARTAIQPLVAGLIKTMQHLHAQRGLALDAAPIEDQLAFRGEEQDLQEMLGNLLDNACKWAKRRVTVHTARDRSDVVITVEDDGKGLSPGEREAMLRRGARADERVPGSGLGLAIVDDLARLYGGRLDLGQSSLGGLRAILTLPAA